MRLLVHELNATPLSQVFTCPKTCNIAAVRPHLIRYGHPTGSLTITIEDAATDTVIASSTVQIGSIASADYFHGYVTFELGAGLREGSDYRVKLEGSGGYSFSESAYIGWCNGYDLGKYDPTYTPENSLHYPLDLELWERKAR